MKNLSDNDQKRKENENEDEDEDRWMYESIIQSNRNRAIQSLSDTLEWVSRFDRDQLFRVLDESFRAREAQSVIHPTTSKIPSSRVVITTPTDDCQGIDPVRSDSSQSKGLESLLSILSTLRIYERQLTLTKDSSMPEGQETINPPTVRTPGPPTHPTHQSCLPVGGSDPQDKGGRTSGNDLPNSSSCPSSSKFKNESRFLDPIERIVQSKSQSKDGGRGEDYLESYLFPETGIDEMMKAEVGYDLNDEGENGGVRGRDEGRVVYDVDCYEDRMLIDFARGLRDE
ncbi:hypothetical protein BY996DRAFT_6423251 [Phakopsora pachyrhizi]|nr:hypothetical protein BY996DRAFT_6423251 [Phakopsora pachyrhizi]